MYTIDQIQAMSPEQRQMVNVEMGKKIMKNFAFFVILKLSIVFAIRGIARKLS